MRSPRSVDRRGLPAPLRVLIALLSEDPADLQGELDRLLTVHPTPEAAWDALLLRAQWEGATPTLARRLARPRESETLPPIPDPHRTVLSRLGMIHEFRLRELHARLDALLDAFEDREIDTLLLKGTAMARRYHPSVVDRPMVDVDLVVAPDRVEMAWNTALELGWKRPAHRNPLEAYEDHHHLPPMGDETGIGLKLEIHTGLLPEPHPFDFEAAEVRAAGEPLESKDADSTALRWARCRIPCAEHLLIHDALHFTWAHICSSGLWKALHDARTLLSSGRLDGPRLMTFVHSARGETELRWLLELCERWTPLLIPETLRGALEVPAPAWLLRRPLARHFAVASGPHTDRRVPVGLNRWLWELAMRPGRAGHGDLRPWQDQEKWIGADGPNPLDRSSSETSDGRLGKAIRGLGYLADLIRPSN